MKIVAAVITVILLAVIGAAAFFFLLLALNGFSERDAAPAIYIFLGWLALSVPALGAASYFAAGFLLNKSWNAILAVTLAVAAPTAVGAVFDLVAIVGGAVVANEIRESHMKKPAVKRQ